MISSQNTTPYGYKQNLVTWFLEKYIISRKNHFFIKRRKIIEFDTSVLYYTKLYRLILDMNISFYGVE